MSPSEESESSPAHFSQPSPAIHQQNIATSGLDEIIMVGGGGGRRAATEEDLADYENQEVIDKAIEEEATGDYENQEVIDKAIEEEETGDYANQSAIDGATKIRGVMPMRSKRGLGDDGGPDYENQDVLDEDIIPFGSFPLPGDSSVSSTRPPRLKYDNEIQLPPPHRPPKHPATDQREQPRDTPERVVLTPTDGSDIILNFGTPPLNKHQHSTKARDSGTLPSVSSQNKAPTAKPRSKTSLNPLPYDPGEMGGSMYSTLQDVAATNGGPPPQYPHSAPKASGDYFDGGGGVRDFGAVFVV